MAILRAQIDRMARRCKGHHTSFKDLKKQMNRYIRRLPLEDTPTHKGTCKYYTGWLY